MIDARGRSCPEPVIMTQKAMASNEASYEVAVDNRVSVENVTRYGRSQGYSVVCAPEGEDFRLTFTK